MIHTILWAIYFILYLIIVSPMRAYYAHQKKKGNREKFPDCEIKKYSFTRL